MLNANVVSQMSQAAETQLGENVEDSVQRMIVAAAREGYKGISLVMWKPGSIFGDMKLDTITQVLRQKGFYALVGYNTDGYFTLEIKW